MGSRILGAKIPSRPACTVCRAGARPPRPGAYHPYMRRAFVVTFAVGLLVAAFGLIWALQGFGVISGSPMSNTTTWSVIGPITVVIGIVITAFSWRKISSK